MHFEYLTLSAAETQLVLLARRAPDLFDALTSLDGDDLDWLQDHIGESWEYLDHADQHCPATLDDADRVVGFAEHFDAWRKLWLAEQAAAKQQKVAAE